MKKVLAILAAFTIGTSALASVIACGDLAAQKVQIEIKDISDLKLRVDIDSSEASYENIQLAVKNLIAEKSDYQNINQEYSIEEVGFNENGLVEKPMLIKVKANDNSAYLKGEFNVIITKNLNKILED
jgi:hypothetical protein